MQRLDSGLASQAPGSGHAWNSTPAACSACQLAYCISRVVTHLLWPPTACRTGSGCPQAAVQLSMTPLPVPAAHVSYSGAWASVQARLSRGIAPGPASGSFAAPTKPNAQARLVSCMVVAGRPLQKSSHDPAWAVGQHLRSRAQGQNLSAHGGRSSGSAASPPHPPVRMHNRMVRAQFSRGLGCLSKAPGYGQQCLHQAQDGR